MQPTLEIHPELHQEFQFAENQVSTGCCCWWNSRPVYKIGENNQLTPITKSISFKERIIAEKKLAEIIKLKFEDDAVDNDAAFERLKLKINYGLDKGKPITEKRLLKIIDAIHELKHEYKC